jgi:hypothetical protein
MTEYDHGWVAKAQNRVYGRLNELICRRLGFTGVSWIYLGFYGALLSLRIRSSLLVVLGVVFALPTVFACTLVLPILSS